MAKDSEKKQHGGAREGAGRTPGSIRGITPRVRMTVDISPDEHARLKAVAAAQGMAPNRWLKMVVQAALNNS